jgi:serine/threonine protein kinase
MLHNRFWHIPPMRQADLDMGAKLGQGGNGEVSMSSQPMKRLSLHRPMCTQAHITSSMQVRAAQHVTCDGPALAVKEPLRQRDRYGRELACFDPGLQDMLMAEYNIHAMLQRRGSMHVLRAVAWVHPDSECSRTANTITGLVTERCCGGSLQDWLAGGEHCRQFPLPWGVRLQLAEHVLLGLKCLHESGVVHLDLKPANILLKGSFSAWQAALDTTLCGHDVAAVVADFGWATHIGKLITRASTPAYSAPEMHFAEADPQFDAHPAAPSMDVYAFGVLLLALVCRHEALYWTQTRVCDGLARKSLFRDLQGTVACEPEYLQLIEQCLQYDARSRPSVDKLLTDIAAQKATCQTQQLTSAQMHPAPVAHVCAAAAVPAAPVAAAAVPATPLAAAAVAAAPIAAAAPVTAAPVLAARIVAAPAAPLAVARAAVAPVPPSPGTVAPASVAPASAASATVAASEQTATEDSHASSTTEVQVERQQHQPRHVEPCSTVARGSPASPMDADVPLGTALPPPSPGAAKVASPRAHPPPQDAQWLARYAQQLYVQQLWAQQLGLQQLYAQERRQQVRAWVQWMLRIHTDRAERREFLSQL